MLPSILTRTLGLAVIMLFTARASFGADFIPLSFLDPNNIRESYAYQVSDDGKVVVGISWKLYDGDDHCPGPPPRIGSFVVHGVLWNLETMEPPVDIGCLGRGISRRPLDVSNGINEDGEEVPYYVVGVKERDVRIPPEQVDQVAFRWDSESGVIKELPSIPNFDPTRATAVSDDGEKIVGNGLNVSEQFNEIFVWTRSGGEQGLGATERVGVLFLPNGDPVISHTADGGASTDLGYIAGGNADGCFTS